MGFLPVAVVRVARLKVVFVVEVVAVLNVLVLVHAGSFDKEFLLFILASLTPA